MSPSPEFIRRTRNPSLPAPLKVERTNRVGAMPTARATHASHRAALRRLGLTVSVTIAGEHA